jgi:dihydrodipicolinate synthase/N-acetylneuraminate lyase
VNPASIRRLYKEWQTPAAESLQQELDDIREILQMPALQMPTMIPALKAVVAHFADDPDWETVRPPLLPLCEDRKSTLLARLSQRGFAMPGLGKAPAS